MKKLGPIVTIDKNASCGEALELMSKNHIHHLIVTENNDPIGLISDRDVFFRWFRGNFLSRSEFEQSPVHYLVRTHLPFITEKTTLLEVSEWMQKYGTSALLSKSGKNNWGIVTETDLLISLIGILKKLDFPRSLWLEGQQELSSPLVQRIIESLVQAGL